MTAPPQLLGSQVARQGAHCFQLSWLLPPPVVIPGFGGLSSLCALPGDSSHGQSCCVSAAKAPRCTCGSVLLRALGMGTTAVALSLRTHFHV